MTDMHTAADGRSPIQRPPAAVNRERAILVARVLLRAPNIDRQSDTALLASEFLRSLGLTEQG